MSAYILNKNHRDNPLGDRLHQARLDQGKTLKKAAHDLNIPIKYLEALENNQPGMLPGADYFDRYLAVYVKYLKISQTEINRLKGQSKIAKQANNFKKQSVVAWTEYLGRVIVLIIVVALIIFFSLKVNAIFMPPELKIISPADGLITASRQVEVKGLSIPEAEIIINNKAVLVDQSGNFASLIDLQKGLNLIKITAKKRYSRINEQDIRVLFNE